MSTTEHRAQRPVLVTVHGVLSCSDRHHGEGITGMSDYNGREVMAEVARKHGWTIHDDTATEQRHALVAYERYSTQVLIIWTIRNTAVMVAKQYGCGAANGEETAKGAGALITARRWLESDPHN